MSLRPVRNAAATHSNDGPATDAEILERYFPVSPDTLATFGSMEAATRAGDSAGYQDLFLAYVDNLRSCFEAELIDTFCDLVQRAWESPGDNEVYDELQAHIFRSGLCEYIFPETLIRGRDTTEQILSRVNHGQFATIVDYGTGDGRTAITVAAKVQPGRLILIDTDPHAVNRARQNFEASGLVCQLLDLESDYRTMSVKRSLLPGRALFLHCFQPMAANGIPFEFLSQQLAGGDVALVAGTHSSRGLPREGIIRRAAENQMSASIPWVRETASRQAHSLIIFTKHPDPPRL